MPFCPNCGLELHTENFCPSCGQRNPCAPRGAPPPQYDEPYDAPRKRRKKGLFAKGRGEKGCPAKNDQVGHEREEREPAIAAKIRKVKADTKATVDSSGDFDEEDIRSHRVFAVLSYLSILVLVPLCACRESPYVKFHVKQGINLVAATIVTLIGRSIFVELVEMLRCPDVLTGLLSVIVSLPFIALLLGIAALSILGIVYVMRGKAKALPYLGGINLLPADDEVKE